MAEHDIKSALKSIDYHLFALRKELGEIFGALKQEPYERLTEYDEYGNADIIGVDSSEFQFNLSFDECNRVTEALNRLAKFEDLLEVTDE